MDESNLEPSMEILTTVPEPPSSDDEDDEPNPERPL